MTHRLRIGIPEGIEYDLANHSVVGDHHSDGSEENLSSVVIDQRGIVDERRTTRVSARYLQAASILGCLTLHHWVILLGSIDLLLCLCVGTANDNSARTQRTRNEMDRTRPRMPRDVTIGLWDVFVATVIK